MELLMRMSEISLLLLNLDGIIRIHLTVGSLAAVDASKKLLALMTAILPTIFIMTSKVNNKLEVTKY
jgi:hypothetical protein